MTRCFFIGVSILATGLEILMILSSVITASVTIFLALITFMKNRYERISRVFIIWMVVSATNAVMFLISQLSFLGTSVNFLRELTTLIGALDPIIAIHFGLLFTQRYVSHINNESIRKIAVYKRQYYGRWYFALYIPWFFLTATMLLFHGVTFNRIITYYNAIMYGVLTYVLMLLYMHYRRSSDENAARSMIVFMGLLMIYINAIAQITVNIIGRYQPYVYILQLILIPLSSVIFAYAVLKLNLLGTQIMLRKSVAYTIFSILTIGVFIVIQESIEEIVQISFLSEIPLSITFPFLGQISLSGIIAALGVAIFFTPIQRMSRKIANRIFPYLLMDEERRVRVDAYRSVLITAWSDGKITDKERRMLETLRNVLEISEAEHNNMVAEILENHNDRRSEN